MQIKLHKVLKSAILLTTTIGTMAFSSQFADAATTSNSFDKVYSTAKKYLGTPYVYGGTTPAGFDCSGYTQYVYKHSINKSLTRTAQNQYDSTAKVSSSNVQKGDLVYFGGSTRSISHVGIYVGNGQMIDAQNNGVIIEQIDTPWWNTVGYSRPTSLTTNTDRGVKYNSQSMNVKVNGSHDFYNHVLGDSKYTRKLSNQGSNYKNKMITIDSRGIVSSNGNLYYRGYYNGKNIGWVYATGLDKNVTYKNTSSTMTVTGKNDFYNHTLGDTQYARKLKNKATNYVGKKVTVDNKATVKSNGSVYYRCYYNGQSIGWVYKSGLK